MWQRVADGIIRFRLPLFILISLVTLGMGYYALKVEMSYDFARTVPLNDPDMIFFNKFKKDFGEDGNMIAIGIKDSALYKLENFEKFRLFSNRIRKIEGITEALSLPLFRILIKDTVNKKFVPM